MNSVINLDSLRLYREAVKKLEESGITYERSILKDNPELCREIVRLLEYCSKI